MAGLTVKHVFQSAKGDGVDASLVQPSNWNASHDLEMDTGNILGRHTAGAGVVEELTPTIVAAMLLTAIQAALSLGALAAKSTIASGDITDGAVANTDLASMTAPAIKGRATTGTGAPEDLTVAQATAMLAAVVGDTGAGGTKGLVPVPAAGDAAARKFLMASGAWAAPSLAPDIILEDHEAQNTAGGTFSAGADRTRVLNTKVRDVLGICTLASNQFTIPAGSYYIEWSAPAFQTDANQSILYDITGGAELKRGNQEVASSSYNLTIRSNGQHVHSPVANNTYEIRHRCQTTSFTNGLGAAGNLGLEIYAAVKIWKIA